MNEIVIVPTFQRSDLLYLCLEHIRAARPDIPIHVFPDRGTDERATCERFNAIHHLTLSTTYHGNSFNMLEALKWVYYNTSERVIHVIEDDVLVDPTYFDWVREALDTHAVFAACGWQFSPDHVPQDGPDVLIPWYLSVCAALPRKSVQSIIQHARPEYYSDMKGYLDAAYPQSVRRGTLHYEQDGLTLRVMEAAGKRCVWPRRPRATHCGWYGYHMNGKPLKGTLENRLKILRLIVKNPALLSRAMAGDALPEFRECEMCGRSLAAEADVRVACADCFHREHPDWVRASEYYYLGPELGPVATV